LIPVEPAVYTGSGEISFSVSAMATFSRYMEKHTALDFVVTIDGERGFYSYCKNPGDRECLQYQTESLLHYCLSLADMDCRVFATSRRIVWERPGMWSTNEKVGMHFFIDHKGVRVDKLNELRE
jgi:hypothetical protein